MKKLLSLIAFAFVMMLSVQTISAQSLSEDQTRAEVVAKAQVADLTTQLGLSGDQSRTLYRAFVTKEVNYRKLVNGKDINNSQVASDKKKTDDVFMKAMKTTLTDKQYAEWLSSLQN